MSQVNEKHTFEMSGLGNGPYTLVSADEVDRDKLEGIFWCEHCGTGIKNRYFIRSSKGVFVVGVDCANKTGDQGIIDGIKRMKREEKAKARMEKHLAEQKALAESALAKYKAEHDGKLPSEMAAELEANYQEIRSAWIDALDDGQYPIVSQLKCSTFARGMNMQAYCGEPFSSGQVRVVKEIIAKKRSGSRKNSKAYHAEMPAIETELEALQVKLREYNETRKSFESDLDYANKMKGWES